MPSFWDLPIESKSPGSLIAEPIIQYLENADKRLDQKILEEMEHAFRRTVMRQLMQPRDLRAGKESNTLYSHPCARKARYIYDGTHRPPLLARAMLKFLLGDIVELAVIGIARLAGLDIGLNNEDLTVQGESDLKLVPVHPDGLLHTNGKHYNVEIKSCDSRTFDKWLEQGGPSDDWGYRTQATVEIKAWQENTWDVSETVFVAVSTGTRQGSIAEWILPFEQGLYDAWQARRTLRQGKDLPPVPFEAEPEYVFSKGKDLDAETLEACLRWAEPKSRVDKNGKVYGWDLPTGRKVLPTICSYCDFKALCWPGVEMEEQGGKPVWIVPAPKSKLLASAEEFTDYLEGRQG